MSTNASPTLGVIGLGSMGMGAACSAVRHGTPTWGFDPRPEALTTFREAGGHAATDLAELARHCDAVLVLVVNAAQTEQVLFGAGGLAEHLKPGSVVITSATVDPALPPVWAQRLEEQRPVADRRAGVGRRQEGGRRPDDRDGLGQARSVCRRRQPCSTPSPARSTAWATRPASAPP